MSTDSQFDLVIVGAGFAGMYMLHRARGAGMRARVFEAGSGVGGTWYWNRYPGARCDVESLEYSYSFDEQLQQDWSWSERYSSQPEILEYANHVADRFDLRHDIEFDTRVESLEWSAEDARWRVMVADTGAGSNGIGSGGGGANGGRSKGGGGATSDAVTARFVVMATGCLSSTNVPDFPGLDDFDGPVYHTGQWPHDGVDFTGKRVAVVGTGSSGIQAIPVIAGQCTELTVFQRTAQYSIPARNAPLDAGEEAEIKRTYAEFREANRKMNGAFGSRRAQSPIKAAEVAAEERRRLFEMQWQLGGTVFTRTFSDLILDDAANATAREFAREKIAAVVRDPEVAALLTPDPSQVLGCKRICLDTNYFETYNLDHVHLIDVSREPIEQFTPTGLRTGGVDYEVDCVVLATGFDAMTGSLTRVDIRGIDGQKLADTWHAGPINYLGLSIPGFPNLFTITGPGSPSVLTNMIMSIEHHVDWITDLLDHMRAAGHRSIEADPDATAAWVHHVNEIADRTLMPTCNSWYLGANIPGKTRVFMPLIGFPPYVAKCAEVAEAGYEGFVLA